jgi:hypothetical protein
MVMAHKIIEEMLARKDKKEKEKKAVVEKEPLLKFNTPTNFSSKEKYGTVWKVEKDSGTTLWMQTNTYLYEDEPKWIKVSDIIDKYMLSGKRYKEWMSVIYDCQNDDYQELLKEKVEISMAAFEREENDIIHIENE